MLNEKDLKIKLENNQKNIQLFTYYRLGLIVMTCLLLGGGLVLIPSFKTNSPIFLLSLIAFLILYKIPYWWISAKINQQAKQVYNDFPLWVSSLEVLIVSHTIVNTLKMSLSTCPKSIYVDLEKLVAILEENPTDKSCYANFLSRYNFNDVKEMMMDLYQFNFLNKDLMIEEFKHLNIRLNKMENVSRSQKQNQQIFLIGALNSIPLFLLSIYILLIANMLSSSLMGNIS